jgi:hypothetical protein
MGGDMEYLRFPAQQTICEDASREINPKHLRERVRVAERAVLSRAQQIENLATDNDEKRAINDALKSLRHLKEISEWV